MPIFNKKTGKYLNQAYRFCFKTDSQESVYKRLLYFASTVEDDDELLCTVLLWFHNMGYRVNQIHKAYYLYKVTNHNPLQYEKIEYKDWNHEVLRFEKMISIL